MRRTALALASPILLAAVAAGSAPAALAAVPQAQSPSRLLEQAYRASMSEAAQSGLSIVVDESSSRPRTLFHQLVPGRTDLEYSYSSRADGPYSMSVTAEGAQLAVWGNNPVQGRWSSLGAAGSWSPAFVLGSALTLETVVTGMNRRLDMDAADEATRRIALDLALAPGTATGGRTWTSMKADRRGATVVVTARAKGRSCTYPKISVTIRNGLIEKSAWTSTCPSTGSTSHDATWRYSQGYTGPRGSTMTQEQAMAVSRNPSTLKSWQALANAANANALTTWSDITRTLNSSPGSVERGLTAVDGLRLLDALIRAGRTLVVQAMPDGGTTRYLLTPSGTVGFVPVGGGLDVGGGTVTVEPDGTISSLRMSYRTADDADVETVTFVR